jgi:hypothetical protein
LIPFFLETSFLGHNFLEKGNFLESGNTETRDGPISIPKTGGKID